MEGRLPRGFCIKRLTDLPMLWSEHGDHAGQFLQAHSPVRRAYFPEDGTITSSRSRPIPAPH